MERLADDGTALARLTFDFLRPVPIAPLTVRAEVTRALRATPSTLIWNARPNDATARPIAPTPTIRSVRPYSHDW